MPGRASSARISSAIRPPSRKNANEVTRYIWPISLWSVVRSRSRKTEPRGFGMAACGRTRMGAGSTADGRLDMSVI